VKNIKVLRFFQGLISLIAIYVIIHIFYQYNEIIDFYNQKTENYADLKQLNDDILDYYQIDLESNEELSKLRRKVRYDEHMISGLEPNTKNAKYYYWYIIGIVWLLIIIDKWIDYKNKPSENETTSE
jgi:type III secretory pathway component EscU